MRRLFDFIKGVFSLAITLGLLFAVPALLGPWTVERASNFVDVVTDELTSDATLIETLLTSGLLLVFWLAWIMLAVSIVTEAIALARGRVARRLYVFPGIQLAAQRLVASCALVLTSFTAMAPAAAAPALVPLPPTAVSASVIVVDDIAPLTTFDTTTTTPLSTSDTTTPAEAAGPTYEVRHGDTWWSMAEKFLGDGLRWEEILEANDGATMNDGHIITTATDSVRAGWVIALPSDAVLPLELASAPTADAAAPAAPVDAAAPADDPDDRIRVGDTDETWDVERGDHFWKIATESLTEAWGRAPTNAEIHPFWIDLIEANEGRLLPPEDPNMIYPNQVFVLPEIPADPEARGGYGDNGAAIVESAPAAPVETEAPADPVVEAEPPAGAETPVEVEAPVETPVEAEAPVIPPVVPDVPEVDTPAETAQPPLTQPGAVPVPAGEQVAAEPVPPTTATSADDDDTAGDDAADVETADTSDGPGFPVVIITGLGLAAAGLVAAIRRLRARRVSERRPGKAPAFTPPSQQETDVTRLADTEALSEINAALRYLGTKLAGRPNPPNIVGVSLATDQLSVLLDRSDPNAPAPFEAKTNAWVLDRPVTLEPPAGAVAPVPALATIGHTSKQQFLLDLEHAGVVNITGTRADVAATMATMAMELAVSPIADQIDIVCIGFGDELAALERVTVAAEYDEVASRLNRHVGDVVEVLDNDDAATAVAGRVNDVGGDSWTPMVVFAPDADPDSELLDLARRTTAAGLTALITSDGQATWQMHLKDGQLQIPHIGVSMKRANLSRQQLATACDLVADARDPEMIEVVDLVAEMDEAPPAASNGSRPAPPVPPAHPWDEPTSAEPAATPITAATPPLPPAPYPDWPDIDYWVEILGPVRVTNRAGEEMSFERAASPQLLAYLTQYRHGVTIDTATEAIFPNRAPSKQRMYNVSSDIRSVLGTDAHDDPYLPKVQQHMMRVSDRVGTDYERFKDLVEYATAVGGSAALGALRDALELVRGDPFTGRGLDWATTSGVYTEVMVAVDEAARTMASIALDKLDRPEDAVWATQQGLVVSPRATELHLLRLRAVLARDDGGIEPDAVWQHYVTVMEEEDGLPEGGSNLDERMIDLYESYRRSNPRRWAAEATTG